MDHVWRKIDELRAEFELLKEDRTPIDVFTFFEVDLGLDAIPFDDLAAKYRVEAAIKADFIQGYHRACPKTRFFRNGILNAFK